MAYYSGTAASLTALRTALLTHAVADGWVLTGDVLSKAGVYFQIQETATNVTCLGCESNAVLNPAPNVVSVGRLGQYGANPLRAISFPCNYEVFGFAQELYLVANYDVDSYQWMAFGKSSVPGLIGQGGWCGASIGKVTVGVNIYGGDIIGLSVNPNYDASGGGYNDMTTGALFWRTSTPFAPFYTGRNCWVNHGLDGLGWLPGTNPADPESPGWRPMYQMIILQPSVWNSESTLIPLRCYQPRPSYKISLVADLVNSRQLRIDNLSPSDILTLGSDQWKIFPWYRKDAANRGGGDGVNHTGTFGWAIRYEGP